MRILLVEPDLVLAKIYWQALTDAGHAVLVAGSAQTAIHAADRHAPELVILELQLAGHGGLEFLHEFRSYEDWHATPVIVCSQVPASSFGDGWPLMQEELGITTHCYKPRTSLAQLLATVREFATIEA